MVCLCQLTTTTGRRRLRSSNGAACEVPRTRTSPSDRSFIVAGRRLWNNLPRQLRDSELTVSKFHCSAFRATYKFAFTLHEYITAVHFGTPPDTDPDYGNSRPLAEFLLCNRSLFIDIDVRCSAYSLSSGNARCFLLRIRFKPRPEECTILHVRRDLVRAVVVRRIVL